MTEFLNSKAEPFGTGFEYMWRDRFRLLGVWGLGFECKLELWGPHQELEAAEFLAKIVLWTFYKSNRPRPQKGARYAILYIM